MALSQHDIELVEQYMLGELEGAEAEEFERRIKEEEDLAEELELHQYALTSLQDYHEVKEDLRQVFNEVKAERGKIRKLNMSYVYAVAAAFILTILAFTYFFLPDTLNNQELYSEYYQPLSASDITRGGSNDQISEGEQEAMLHFSNGQYAEAASKFEYLLTQPNVNDKWQVYLANCYMQIDNDDKAYDVLKKAQLSSSNFTQQYAEWYMALLMLKQGELTEVKALLNHIVDQEGMYQTKATQLLGELE